LTGVEIYVSPTKSAVVGFLWFNFLVDFGKNGQKLIKKGENGVNLEKSCRYEG